MSSAPLLRVDDLVVDFVRDDAPPVRAVAGVDLRLEEGRVLALVGESGCGKSTLARAIAGLVRPSQGRVELRGRAHALGDPTVQMVFQDPDSSLNPRLTVGAQIAEPLRLHRGLRGAELDREVGRALERVGIDPGLAQRHPHAFSGGQRQRIAIARALALEPALLLCDEVTSALDVSVQAQVLELLAELRRSLGLAMLFITHDLAVARAIADEAAVMYLGRIVEQRSAEALFAHPAHPYSRALLGAVPRLPERGEGARLPEGLPGDPPSPAAPPPGCPFHPRCSERLERCGSEEPPQRSPAGGPTGRDAGFVRCWLGEPGESP